MDRLKATLFSPKFIVFCSFLSLAVVTFYCSWHANVYTSGNADDIVYPYLFKHFQRHDMVLPSQHSNILKFPLFFLQSLLPYNFTTFSIVTIGLVLATILGWTYLAMRLFGRRYAPLLCVGIASILLATTNLNDGLLGNTIRNIEYPIALGFIMCVAALITKRPLSRFKRLVIGGAWLLFSLTVAGDSLFLYAVPAALLTLIGYFWWRDSKAAKRRGDQRFAVAAAFVVSADLLGLAIRMLIKFSGVASYYTDSAYLPRVLSLDHLGPSLATAATQLIDLSSAHIFGLTMAPKHAIIYVNFVLLALGLFGLYRIIADIASYERCKKLIATFGFERLFALGALSVSGALICLLYISSDQVVSTAPGGAVVSAGQSRYITMIPLLLSIGLVYLIRQRFDARRLLLVGLPAIALPVFAMSHSTIGLAHADNDATRVNAIAIAKTTTVNRIPLVVTGYWYGSPIRFWSHDRTKYTSVAFCNVPEPPINIRLSSYRPDPGLKTSALIISHTGINASFSTCSDQQLQAIYGRPARIINVNSVDKPVVWVYNYDIRTKLAPLPPG